MSKLANWFSGLGTSDRDWRNSAAHLLLLSRFRCGDDPANYSQSAQWISVLSEQPETAIQRFVHDRVLEPADLKALVDHKFKATELKAFLKERGLKVSGRKDELVNRLINNDAQRMKVETEGLDLYKCTALGLELAEQYLGRERTRRTFTEQKTLAFLRSGNLTAAMQTVLEFERTQVFARVLGVNSDDGEDSDVLVLKDIFNKTPPILRSLPPDLLGQLRALAAMMHLWGTNDVRPWTPQNFETRTNLDPDTASRMFVFHAWHLRSLRQYRESGVKTVKLFAVGDSMTCQNCEKMNDKIYSLRAVPKLPMEKCSSDLGCRCTTVVEDFDF